MEKIKNTQITINRFKCASLDGLSAKVVDVEATFTKGLPSFSVVGLASSDIQESKERVKSALLTNGFTFPPLKITVNLSPSDIKKSGTHFDLPIALLVGLNQIELNEDQLFVFGELGLDGKIKSSSMIFPLILSLKEQGLIQKAIVPLEALEYLRHISDVEFIAIESIDQAIELISTQSLDQKAISYEYKATRLEINQKEFFYTTSYKNDFYDIKGQSIAKRASLIAACGMHNFLMQGSPGCGKSMISKRLNDILPPLSKDEILSIAKHQFLDGTTPDFNPKRPLRSPHHTATSASIFGGGS
ncbi:MAG: ATP-binding protein, partial [Campylobacterales bacterium]|nr:ATP-binding protein [Campylobacterales bacterium]